MAVTPLLLHRTAGRETAAAMGLFGEEVRGEQAVERGLAWAAVDDDAVEQTARDVAARVAADPQLARRLVQSFRRETAPGGLPREVAVEVERSPQMWSLRRKHEG
ncbi:enoyl-CoA hydratase-related protein [Janibacter limosus]|uniref:enoyl-CoA hydratase-related protein n=1 Tax=Janibacter limosus TaxID=53458 RepID=UPI00215259F4|nr:enoyl-CoA hydratase-related protein [Janibacter limosus]WKV15922.1 enoyl-CoA hydratase-related protein [Janibacter limosus]